jgi:sulfite dehydrogenase (quinone) subunit SoeC
MPQRGGATGFPNGDAALFRAAWRRGKLARRRTGYRISVPMQPALSVIFFTTLSGAGYGLLVWLGISIALLHARASTMQAMHGLQLAALALGLLLSTIGLLCSLGHLGQPQRAWRALSQWRTSWLSREGVLALLTMLPALAIGVMLVTVKLGPDTAPLVGLLGFALAALSLATVACTAMIYASLKPIPAWRHAVVVPVYLLFSLLTGLALLFLLIAVVLPGGGSGVAGMLATVTLLGGLLVATKWLYWRDIDRTPLPATRADAVGLPGREVGVFERPHTEANYITREMAFTVARERALQFRLLASALVFVVPLLAWGLASVGAGHASWLLTLAALGTLAGAFVERWLFFAQARHMVTLYY